MNNVGIYINIDGTAGAADVRTSVYACQFI